MDNIALLPFVSGILGLLIPLATEAVTKVHAPLWVKSTVTFLLSVLAGAIATVVITDFSTVQDYLLAIGVAWVATMRSYFAGMAVPIVRAKQDSAPQKHVES